MSFSIQLDDKIVLKWFRRRSSCQSASPDVNPVCRDIYVPSVISYQLPVDDELVQNWNIHVNDHSPVAMNEHTVSCNWKHTSGPLC